MIIPGWFWSGSGVRIHATNETAPGWRKNPWSNTGKLWFRCWWLLRVDIYQGRLPKNRAFQTLVCQCMITVMLMVLISMAMTARLALAMGMSGVTSWWCTNCHELVLTRRGRRCIGGNAGRKVVVKVDNWMQNTNTEHNMLQMHYKYKYKYKYKARFMRKETGGKSQ